MLFSQPIKKFKLYQDRWLPSGWRRSAILNIGLMSIIFVILFGILLASASSGKNFNQAWQLYTEDCRRDKTASVSTILHLIINAMSTVALASSNFFMQVLNAPSREEVDRAHAKEEWLDIGIPSWRNAFRLSRFKTTAWLVLFLTSIPIHMFFNSSIFLMNARMGNFHVTVASESFVQGEPYYLPGASLMTREALSNASFNYGSYYSGSSAMQYLLPAQYYFNGNFSGQEANVSEAAAHAPDWDRLESQDCRNMYSEGTCSGLTNYKSVIVVIKGQGWKRSEIWNLSSTADRAWETIVPRSQINSVWLSRQCSMDRRSWGGKVNGVSSNLPFCNSDCGEPFDEPEGGDTWPSNEPWIFNVTNGYKDVRISYSRGHLFNTSLYAAPGNKSQFGLRYDSPYFDIQAGSPLMQISHCLAEPRESTCSVALSKPLFLAVVLSILVKVMACTLIVRVLGKHESLVTPGDAIASFISLQDNDLYDSGILTQQFVRDNKARAMYSALGPRRWVNKQQRQASAVPRSVWVGTYIILMFGIILLTVSFQFQLQSQMPLRWDNLDSEAAGSLLTGVGAQSPFLSSVITVNIPQLYLSFWYLAYNSLLTRLEMSREWGLFYTHYRPLRVAHPRGQQIATYRLQLPYKYSITMMILSTLMHWLMSSALFVMVSQGDFYRSDYGFLRDAVSLPKNAVVVVGTLSLPVLILIILGSAMVLFPVALSRRNLPGFMPIVGSNSVAMMAACRVSPLAKVPKLTNEENIPNDHPDTELEELVPESRESTHQGNETSDTAPVKNIALCLLKWGEVEMPDEWYRHIEWRCRTTEDFKHLSFGTTLDDPSTPIEGCWYI